MNRERFIKLPVTLVEITPFRGKDYLDRDTLMYRYFFLDEEDNRYVWNTGKRLPYTRFSKCLLSATPLGPARYSYPTTSVTRGKVYNAPADS